MEEVKQPAIRVFFSYAHEDTSLRDELEKHLGNLKRQGYITNWHDRDISAGKEWKHEIDKNLSEADIILLLVSPDFIHSDYCYGNEMKAALEKHKTEEARAIPIILRPVDWEDAPFSNLQALPTDGKPITTWLNRDEAFLDVTKGIRKVVKELLIEKYLDIAEELADEDQNEKALTFCECAIRLDSTAHEAYYFKTNLLIGLERYSEALTTCQKVIDLVPKNPDYYDKKADILLTLNRHEEALDALEQAIGLAPLDDYRYYQKGKVLFSLGRYEEALNCYQRAIDIQTDDEEWFHSNAKGDALFELGRYEEAITAYNKAVEGWPDGDEVAYGLRRRGEAFFKLDQFEEALDSYIKAEEMLEYFYGGSEKPEFVQEIPTFKKDKGDALFKLGRFEEALAAYQQAIDFAPNTSEYFQGKGDTLFQLKRFEEALAAFDHVIRLAPGTPTAYRKKAMIYEQLGKQANIRAIEIQYESQIVTTYEGWISKLGIRNDVPHVPSVFHEQVINIDLNPNLYLEIVFSPGYYIIHELSLNDKVTVYLSYKNRRNISVIYLADESKNTIGIEYPILEINQFQKDKNSS